jgi:hypothetical protein
MRVKFAPVEMLRQAPVADSERRRLRELLLLALRVAALLLLALAFARPFFTSGTSGSAGLTIVALDVSMSLSAPGQFERARQLAKDAIRRAPAGDLVGVVAFSDTAQEVTRPTGDRMLAAAAVEAVRPGFGGTRYRAALDRAADMIHAAGGRRSTIVIVSDLQDSGWDTGDRASVPESARVELADVGQPPANLAVVAARLSGDRIVATIRNTGAQARDVRVHVAAELATLDAGPASHPSNGGDVVASVGASQSADVTLAAPRGRWATVFVDDPAGIPGDNARYVLLNPSGRPSVLVITTSGDLSHDAFYLQQALTAAGRSGAPYGVEGVSAAQFSRWDWQRLGARTAVVLLSTRSLEKRGRDLLSEYLRQGGGLLVAAGPEVDGAVVAEALGDPKTVALTSPPETRNAKPQGPQTLAPADVRHPVFQLFGAGAATLGLAKFARTAPIEAPGCQTLARFSRGDPALVDCTPGDGRLLIFASDLDNQWNDLPLHATFVPFVNEAVRYLAGARLASAEYTVGEAPPGVPQVPGVTTLTDGGGASRLVAVNVNPNESDPGRLSADEFLAAVTRLKDVNQSAVRFEARQQEERQQVWWYVLVVMAAALIIESLVAKRTA